MTVRLPDTSIWGRYAGMNQRDPFDPSAPGYSGAADSVMPYQSSLQERVLAMVLGSLAPVTPGATVPRPAGRMEVPDESSAYYLKPTAQASAARPVEHQWMLEDPRIGQNQIAPDLSGDPDSPATFNERWMLDNPRAGQNQSEPNLLRRPVGRNNVPPAPNSTEPGRTPLPRPKPRYMVDGYSPHTVRQLQTLVPLAAEMWIENAEALKAQGIILEIHQGSRDETRNRQIGGAKESQHLKGTAMDIPFSGFTTAQQKAVISQLLSDPRVNGFGYYPDRGTIHVDIRNGKRYAWGENYSWTSIGKGWPQWLTDQVLEWWPDAPIQPRTQKRKPQ